MISARAKPWLGLKWPLAIGFAWLVAGPLLVRAQSAPNGERPEGAQRRPVAAQSAEERSTRQAQRRRMLEQRFDANDNGMLDPDERRALREFFAERARRQAPPLVERKPRLDLSPLLSEFDEDGDGMLDPEERQRVIARLKRST